MAKQRTPADVFVRTYNECNSIGEVAERLGTTVNNVHQRRHTLAQKGVRFKVFPSNRGGNRLNVESLVKLSETLVPEGTETFKPETRETATAS